LLSISRKNALWGPVRSPRSSTPMATVSKAFYRSSTIKFGRPTRSRLLRACPMADSVVAFRHLRHHHNPDLRRPYSMTYPFRSRRRRCWGPARDRQTALSDMAGPKKARRRYRWPPSGGVRRQSAEPTRHLSHVVNARNTTDPLPPTSCSPSDVAPLVQTNPRVAATGANALGRLYAAATVGTLRRYHIVARCFRRCYQPCRCENHDRHDVAKFGQSRCGGHRDGRD